MRSHVKSMKQSPHFYQSLSQISLPPVSQDMSQDMSDELCMKFRFAGLKQGMKTFLLWSSYQNYISFANQIFPFKTMTPWFILGNAQVSKNGNCTVFQSNLLLYENGNFAEKSLLPQICHKQELYSQADATNALYHFFIE